MEESGDGHINATSSTRGLTPTPPTTTYNVAEAALVAYMETFAHELRAAGSGVGVSVLCPGTVATRFLDNALGLAAEECRVRPPDELEALSRAQAGVLEHGTDPEEIARIFVDGIEEVASGSSLTRSGSKGHSPSFNEP